MARDGLDAIVAMSIDNVTYTLGVTVPSQKLIRERRVVVLVPKEGAPAVVCVTVEQGFLQANIDDDQIEIRPYDEHTETAMQVLSRLVAERGLGGGRLGLELDFMPAQDYEELRERLPCAQFQDIAPLYRQLRMVKTPREVERVRQASSIAEQAIQAAFDQASAGMTERELGMLITQEFLSRGGDEMRLLIVGAGERSSYPNAPPTNRVLQPGDIVKIDLLGTHDGYFSDCARTAVVGEPAAEHARLYQRIVEIYEKILEQIRPGVSTRTLYAMYDRAAQSQGLQPLRFLGHGLGLSVHEAPFIDAHTDVALTPGMVMAIEPVHYVPHDVGLHVEDQLVITETGHEIFTHFMDTTRIYPIRD